MLSEKCPFCGSYNDVEAAECYFCHKDLPDTPGHKKKRKGKSAEKPSISLPPSIASSRRKAPPGCLVLFVAFFFVVCAIVIWQWINTAYQITQWKIPLPATEAGQYISYYIEGLVHYTSILLQYPIIVVSSILIILLLSWGLLNLKRWARTLVMMLLVILLLANFALFVTFVMSFYTTPVNVISFCLILLGIGLNAYCLLWFFERKKTFE